MYDVVNCIVWFIILVAVIVIIWWFWGGQSSSKPIPPPEDDEEVEFSQMSEEDEIDHPPVDMTPTIPTDLSIPRLSNEGMHMGVRSNSRKSKGETLCHQAIERLTGKTFVTVRPDWLKNPETRRNLELDCYNDELKIALEYNGEQHYKWPNFTGQTYEEFINQVRRDKFKVDQCDRYGVYLITVPYSVTPDRISDYINYYLPHNVLLRQQARQPQTSV